jgi:hypothetical protein
MTAQTLEVTMKEGKRSMSSLGILSSGGARTSVEIGGHTTSDYSGLHKKVEPGPVTTVVARKTGPIKLDPEILAKLGVR